MWTSFFVLLFVLALVLIVAIAAYDRASRALELFTKTKTALEETLKALKLAQKEFDLIHSRLDDNFKNFEVINQNFALHDAHINTIVKELDLIRENEVLSDLKGSNKLN